MEPQGTPPTAGARPGPWKFRASIAALAGLGLLSLAGALPLLFPDWDAVFQCLAGAGTAGLLLAASFLVLHWRAKRAQ